MTIRVSVTNPPASIVVQRQPLVVTSDISSTQTQYNTFALFQADVLSGALDTLGNGATVDVAGVAYVKDDSRLFIPGLPDWRFPWQVQKHLITSDLQTRDTATSPGEIARQQGVLDVIASRHPDLTHAYVDGDAVDTASENTTMAAPEYGFPELLADWRLRMPIPLENTYFTSGNHDQDGNAASTLFGSYSMQTYRRNIGPEAYYTVNGNLMNIHLGFMGGGSPGGGTITDPVVAAFRRLVMANKKMDIFLHLHHPLSGTYAGETEATNPSRFQKDSVRITDILDEVAADADNIAAVFFGHVGSDPAGMFSRVTLHGTEHVHIGMHLPSNVNEGRDDFYYVINLVHGATTFSIDRWNASTDAYVDTETFTLAHPLQLGSEVTRHPLGPSLSPLVVAQPIDELYEDVGGGSYEIPDGTQTPLLTLRTEDRSNKSLPDNFGQGIQVDWGNVGTGGDFTNAATYPAFERAAWLTVCRRDGEGTAASPTLAWRFQVVKNGTLEEALYADADGLQIGHDGTVTNNPATGSTVGVTVSQSGFVSGYRTSGATYYAGRLDDGNLFQGYRATVLTGALAVDGSDFVIKSPAGNVVVEDDLVLDAPTVPSSASDTGVAGQISWDANFIYVCTATDTWKRASIATW